MTENDGDVGDGTPTGMAERLTTNGLRLA